MFEIRGEILIERLIRQLKEADIKNIAVVVGYMKEAFFYLEDEFNVRIIINPEYSNRNNHSSLWAAREHLGNSYIISSDQFYSRNIFRPYEFMPFCSAVRLEKGRSEQLIETDENNRIIYIGSESESAYRMQGPAYFDKALSNRFLAILEQEYNRPATIGKLWDTVLAEHLDEFSIALKPWTEEAIHEFDYISDLCSFDQDFFENVDSNILDNICSTIKCARTDIEGIEPVKAGLTNLSVLFSAKGDQYIYRHPGTGTDEIINRDAEAHSLRVAKKLGFDETFIYEDPKTGWKISRYIPNCVPFDYRNEGHVTRAMRIARKLHESGETSPWSFDFYEEAKKIVSLLIESSYPLPPDFDAISSIIEELACYEREQEASPVLCHNDFYGPNFLINDQVFYLIDWEYSAMGDYGCDIGNFIAQGSGYTEDEAVRVLDLYFGRQATDDEVRHCLACTAIVGYYWFVWAVYKESKGNPVGEWLYTWYTAAKRFGTYALSLHTHAEGGSDAIV